MKTILITGCSSGIGKALAKACLLANYKVVAGARNLDSLTDISHPNLIPISLDVNSPADIDQAIKIIEQKAGYLNGIINNAGYAAMGPVAELSTEQLQQQFATNVFAPIALTKAMLPLLRKAASKEQPAQVVNIGSVSGVLTTPFSGAYCATKSALHSLSDALRMELKPFYIEVVTVQPGGIESEFGNNSLKNLAGVISADSIFAPLKANIEKRATASQENPTPATEFAQTLLQQLQQGTKPIIRIGKGSTLLPFLKKWLPTKTLDKILSKKFGLDRL